MPSVKLDADETAADGLGGDEGGTGTAERVEDDASGLTEMRR